MREGAVEGQERGRKLHTDFARQAIQERVPQENSKEIGAKAKQEFQELQKGSRECAQPLESAEKRINQAAAQDPAE